MDIRVAPRADDTGRAHDIGRADVIGRADDIGQTFNASRPNSAASWGAIMAGALVAIGISLILVTLGAGLGFASISPWPNHGLGLGAFTVTAAIWLIVTQWVSSLFGGYITGRLRTRWIGTHEHEIFFRDTANGLVTWALATVAVATLLASSASSAISGGATMISGVAGAAAQGAAAAAGAAANTDSSAPGAPGSASPAPGSQASPTAMAYGLDKLFRPSSSMAGSTAGGAPTPATAGVPRSASVGSPAFAGDLGNGTIDPRVEAGHILVHDLSTGSVPDADRAYLAGLVVSRTGLTDGEAQKRVNDVIDNANAAAARVKAAADEARKDGAEVAIYTALSMLIGAFIASVAAALGGRLRDEHL